MGGQAAKEGGVCGAFLKMFMKENTEGAGAGAESSFLGQERLKHHR